MDDQESKNYEISFLTKEEQSAQNVLSLLRKFGAEIIFEGPRDKINLAYEIKKETSAYFGYVDFILDPQKIKELNEELKFNSAILRFLIIIPPLPKARTKAEPIIRMGKAPVEKKSLQPLSNEALEKKLEEILK